MKHRTLIIFAIISTPLILFTWLVNRHFLIIGPVTISHDFGRNTPFVYGPYPEGRVEGGDGNVLVVGDPVYIDVTVPSAAVDQINIELDYGAENTFAEFGFQKGPLGHQIHFEPLFHPVLEDMKRDTTWSYLGENVFVRPTAQKFFSTAQEFFENPPPLNTIGIYDAQWNGPVIIDDYIPSRDIREYDVVLRGRHEIKTYLDTEPLYFVFDVVDINRHVGADTITVHVFDDSRRSIWSQAFPDDGVHDANGLVLDTRQVVLDVPDLDQGVYTIVVDAHDDTFFKKITTSQRKFVFKNRLYLAGNREYADLGQINYNPTLVYTTARHLSFYTSHAAGLQTLSIDQQPYVIDVVHEKYETARGGYGIGQLGVPKNDMIITGRGYYGLSEDAVFYPEPRSIDPSVSLDEQGIHYVVTEYEVGERVYNVNTDDVWIDNGVLRLTISQPFRHDDSVLALKDMKVVYTRTTDINLASFFMYLHNIYERLF